MKSPPEPTPYEKLLAEIAEAGDKLVVINFGATWCGECNLMKLYVVGLRRMTPNVVFLDVDIDQNREAAFHYEIAAVPTFKFLKNSDQESISWPQLIYDTHIFIGLLIIVFV